MKTILARSLLAGAFVLSLTFPLWAADQAANTQQEKAQTNSDEVKKIQEVLKAKGEDPGSMDGIMGRKTRAAVKAFQKTNGLKVTGTVDHETAEKLGIQLATTSGTQAMKEENK